MNRGTSNHAMQYPDIDRLYQVPLGEFTTARNALAKARGAAGAEIKTLEKPSLPAWAVNQLYWQARDTYDRVVAAAMLMREAHVHAISGRKADVAAAEAAHSTARRAAIDVAKRLIEATGERATPATLEAVSETLQALPSNDVVPGRLTRPLKPLGFGALMALGIPVVQESRGPGVQRSGGLGVQGVQGSSGPSKAELAARAAARKDAQKALRSAEAAEVKAEAALADAKKAALQAERELARVRDKLVFLEKQRDDAESNVRKQTRALQDAANARLQAAQDLGKI